MPAAQRFPGRRWLALALLPALAASCTAPATDERVDERVVVTEASTATPATEVTSTPPPATEPTPRASEPARRPRRARVEEFAVPAGHRPHDVAPAPDGTVWYTAQGAGRLGRLDPRTGDVEEVGLGDGSAPHGVIVAADGAAWVTDGGLNAIVRVDADNHDVDRFALPRPAYANLNTAAFDGNGTLWFTGQSGIYGRVEPDGGAVEVFDAPKGEGPYGIAATPDGTVWFSSLAGSYIARVDSRDGSVEVVDVPTAGGGARRVWSDSRGRLWVTEWFAGKLARYDPARDRWREWTVPGSDPQPYAVYVDEDDLVWVSDFGADAVVSFDPHTQRFRSYPNPTAGAAVRQLLGRAGEVWGAGSAVDTLLVLRNR